MSEDGNAIVDTVTNADEIGRPKKIKTTISKLYHRLHYHKSITTLILLSMLYYLSH